MKLIKFERPYVAYDIYVVPVEDDQEVRDARRLLHKGDLSEFFVGRSEQEDSIEDVKAGNIFWPWDGFYWFETEKLSNKEEDDE